jgi:hypothetical protein
MSGVDGFGDVVTGAMVARAVEPQAGEADRDDGHTHERSCLNCGAPLAGPYCAACGQKAHLHRSLRAFGGDMIAGLFNLEGKIWRTLPMLAWCPGDLTRRYVEGERARYISPVALYLFSVFAMFAVLNFNGGMSPSANGVKAGVDIAEADEREALIRLEERRKAAAESGKETATLDRAIAEKKDDLATLERVRTGKVVETDGLEEGEAPAWVRTVVENAQADPEMAVFKVQDAASKYSWALIPLSLPFMWLLFPFRRQVHLYDHAVFVTYSLSFMMGLAIVGGLLVAAGYSAVAGFLFFVPPFHIYRQLKGAYSLSRLSALWRTIVLLIFSFIVLVMFAAMMVALGLFE